MIYLKETKASKRILATVLSLLMIFSMFSMLTGIVGLKANASLADDYAGIIAQLGGSNNYAQVIVNGAKGSDTANLYRTGTATIDGQNYITSGVTATNAHWGQECVIEGNPYQKASNVTAYITICARLTSGTLAANDGICIVPNGYPDNMTGHANFKKFSDYADLSTTADTWFVIPTGATGNSWVRTGIADADQNVAISYMIYSTTAPTVPVAVKVLPPDNVTATANGQTMIDLSWNAVDGATSYEVFRSTSANGTYTSQGTVTTNEFHDTGLSADTTYYYKVQATTADGTSPDSDVASAKTDATPSPAFVVYVDNVTANAGQGFDVEVTVVNDGTADASEDVDVTVSFNGQNEYASIEATYLTTGNDAPVTAHFTAPANAADQTQYTVTATATSSESSANGSGTVTVNNYALSLSVPNVNATANSSVGLSVVVTNNGHMAYAGGDSVSVTFNSNAVGSITLPAVAAGGSQTIPAGNVTAPKYDGAYTATATLGGNTVSGNVNVTGGLTPDGYYLEAEADGIDTINLSWTANSSVTGYYVYRSTNGNNFTQIGTTTDNFYTDNTVNPATTYYYKIRSYTVTQIPGNEIFTIKSENGIYNGITDYYAIEDGSSIKMKYFSSAPSRTTNPEAYWYQDGNYLRNYATNNYAYFTGSSASTNGSDTYTGTPQGIATSATAGSNSSYQIGIVKTNYGSCKESNTYTIYQLSSNTNNNYTNLRQWACGAVYKNFNTSTPAVLISAIVAKAPSEGSCGRHFVISNRYTLPGGEQTTEGELSNPADATTDTADQPVLAMSSVANVSADLGASFTATATVINNGLAPQTDSFDVTFTFNGVDTIVTVTDDVAAGATLNVTTTLTAPTGVADQATRTITATVGTSSKDGTLTVNAPNIVVTSVSNEDATANTAFSVDVVVTNEGHMSYAGGDTVAVTFEGDTQNVTIPEIASGDSETVSASFTAPMNNGSYTVTATINDTNASGTITVTGGADPDDVDPYSDTPTKEPTLAPNFNVDYATFVSGPYILRNDYTGFGYQYIYDTTNNNNYTGTENGSNGSDNTSYSNYGRALRQVTDANPQATIIDNQNYMWNIYSVTAGGTTYYMLRNVATGRYMHTGAYGDWYDQDGDNNSINVYDWNANLVNGANGFNNGSQANRELSYYAFSLPSYTGSTGTEFTSQIVNRRFAWGGRPLHGELAGNHNTTERKGRLFATSNDYGWGTKTFRFIPASITTEVADLTITSATVSPMTVPFGTNMAVSATIKNEGNADIANGTPILVKFVFNGKMATATYTAGLAQGASATVNATIKPNKLTADSDMIATVNADWSLDESSFTNNTYTVEEVAVIDNSEPVLVVDSVANVSADTGATFTATARINNIGGAEQTDSFDVTFTLNGNDTVVTVTDDVDANDYIDVTATLTAPAGATDGDTHTITATIGLSSANGTLTVNAPNLVATSVSDEAATASTAFTVDVVITNSGHMAYAGGGTVSVTFEGDTQNVAVPAIAAGGSVTVNASFTAPMANGAYTATATINATNSSGTITVTGGTEPDDVDPYSDTPTKEPISDEHYYVIQSVGRNYFLYDDGGSYLRWNKTTTNFEDAESTANMQWQLIQQDSKYVIKNVGTGRIISSTNMQYLGWDGNHYNAIDMKNEPASYNANNDLWELHLVTNESATSNVYTVDNANLAAVGVGHMYWSTYLTGTADGASISNPNGNIVTSTQGNDNAYRQFRFVEYNIQNPDLTITSATVNPMDVPLGDSMAVSATIRNDGAVAIPADTDILVKFVFNGKMATATYSDGLAAGGTAVVNATITPNKYTNGAAMTATVNADWAVDETDFTNNTYTVNGVTVVDASQAVLHVTSVANASAEVGETFTASAVISNIGLADQTDSFDVTFTLNGNDTVVTVTDDVESEDSITVEAELTAPAGVNGDTYTITVSVAESSSTGTLTIKAPVVAASAIADTEVNALTAFNVSVTVTNSGAAASVAGGTIPVTFNNETVNVTLPAIAAGANAVVTAAFTAPQYNGEYPVTSGSAEGTVTVVNGDDADTDPDAPVGPADEKQFFVIQSVQRNYFLYDDGGDYLRWNKSTTDISVAAATANMQWQLIQNNGKYIIKNVGTGRIISSNLFRYLGYDGSNYNTIDMATDSGEYGDRNLWNLNLVTSESSTSKIYTLNNAYLATVNGGYFWSSYLTGTAGDASISNPDGNIVVGTQRDNGNNSASHRQFRFVEYNLQPADLTVTNVDVSSTSLSPGDTLTVTATIENDSTTNITDDIVVKFAFDGRIVRTTYTDGLDAGDTAQVVAEIPVTKVTDGDVVTVTVNSDWAVDESDYTNNTNTSSTITVLEGIKVIDNFNRTSLDAISADLMVYEAAKDSTGVVNTLTDNALVLDTTDDGAELYLGRILDTQDFVNAKYLVFKIKSDADITSGINFANGYRDNLAAEDYADIFTYNMPDNSISKVTDEYKLIILNLKQFKLRLATDDFPYDIFDISMIFDADLGTISIDEIYLADELPNQDTDVQITIVSIDPDGDPDPVEMDASGAVSKNKYTFDLTVSNNGTTSWNNPVIQYVMGTTTYTASIPENTVVPADGSEVVIPVTINAPMTDDVTEITFVAVDDSMPNPSITVDVVINNVTVDADEHGDAPEAVGNTYIIKSEQTGMYLYDGGYTDGYVSAGQNALASTNNMGAVRMQSYAGLPNGNSAAELAFQWYVERQDNGNYKITNAATGRSLATCSAAQLASTDASASGAGTSLLADVVPQSIFTQDFAAGTLNTNDSDFQTAYAWDADSKYWALEVLADDAGSVASGADDMHVAMYTNSIHYGLVGGNFALYYLNSGLSNDGTLDNGLLNISARTTSNTATHFDFISVAKSTDLEVSDVKLYEGGNLVNGIIVKANDDDEVTVTVEATFTNNSEVSVASGTTIDVKFSFDGKLSCVPYTLTSDLEQGDEIVVSTTFTTTELYPDGIPVQATVNADWNSDPENTSSTLVHGYELIRETDYVNNTNFDMLVIDTSVKSEIAVGVGFYDSTSEYSGSTVSVDGAVGPTSLTYDSVPATITLVAEAASGFKFEGWYYGDELLYTTPTVTVTAYSDITYTAKFVVGKLTLTLDVSGSGSITRKSTDGLLDIPVSEYPSDYNYDAGDAVRLVAEAGDGYTFSRWVDDKLNTVSESVDYTFAITADTNLTAVFIPSENVNIYFVDSLTGRTYYQTSVASGSTVTYEGVTPFIDGYTWTGWNYDLANDTFDADTIIYTTYVQDVPTNHTLTVILPNYHNSNYNLGVFSLAPNETTSISTLEDVNEMHFSYWRANGKVLSLNPIITLQMPYSNVTLEAVYDAPDVEKYQNTYAMNFEGWITSIDDSNAIQNTLFSLNAACINGEGDEFVSMGALLLAVEGDEVPTSLTLNTPGVKRGTIKTVADNPHNPNYGYTNMYVIRLSNPQTTGMHYYTRAFVVYRDIYGEEHTVYADDIMDCSNVHLYEVGA